MGFHPSYLLIGIYSLSADSFQRSQLSRQGADDILISVHGNADDGDTLFRMWYSHPADYVASVFMKQRIERFYSCLLYTSLGLVK